MISSHPTAQSSRPAAAPRTVKTAPADPPGFRNALVEAGLINRQQMTTASEHASHWAIAFAEAVVALGFARERDVYLIPAQTSGLELTDLDTVTPSALAVRLIPEKVARRHGILPISQDNRTLTYAVTCPYHDEAERDVSFVSGRQRVPCSRCLHSLVWRSIVVTQATTKSKCSWPKCERRRW